MMMSLITFVSNYLNEGIRQLLDRLNVMSTIHIRKLIATLDGQRDAVIEKLEERDRSEERRVGKEC